MSDLKPCPFCGGQAEPSTTFFASKCMYCTVCCAFGPVAGTDEDAATLWNQRIEAISAKVADLPKEPT